MGRRTLRSIGVLACAAVMGGMGQPARGAFVTYNINANGTKEVSTAGVPSQGDPDGTAIGTLVLDNGTGSGTTGSATFTITLTNIDLSDLRGHHIHSAASNTTGPIVIDFGDPDTVLAGNILAGTVSNLPSAIISNVFANPTGFYYNLHNSTFTGGAVRDQLPEPGLAGFAAAAALGLLRRRRA